MVTVLLIDGSKAFALGLSSLLDATGEFKVVDIISSGNEADDKMMLLRPDIAIIELHIAPAPHIPPDFQHGIALIQRLHERYPDTRLLAISFVPDDQWITQAIHAGAVGFVNKGASEQEFVRALRTVYRGGVALTQEQMQRMMQVTHNEPGRLTSREIEILKLVAQDMTNTQIARALLISEGTVRAHMRNILRKLDVRSRYAAVRKAREWGMI